LCHVRKIQIFEHVEQIAQRQLDQGPRQTLQTEAGRREGVTIVAL
jgi:hypothetical protein